MLKCDEQYLYSMYMYRTLLYYSMWEQDPEQIDFPRPISQWVELETIYRGGERLESKLKWEIFYTKTYPSTASAVSNKK